MDLNEFRKNITEDMMHEALHIDEGTSVLAAAADGMDGKLARVLARAGSCPPSK